MTQLAAGSPSGADLPPVGLYVHLPWCVQKCPYCDFNSHALRGELPTEAYLQALLRDFDFEAARLGERRIETVFFGGGTPSLFPPEAVDRLLRAIGERANLAAEAEITLEANPGTVEQARFEGYRAAGVNRLSIGIQSFEAEKLHRLGRIHGRDEALRAAEAARAAGFDNFNLDLMYGLPEQSLQQALNDLHQAIALAPSHISHYQLTLEPNTLFHAKPPALPDDDLVYEMQLACQALLAKHGYAQYEVSAYTRDGARCRHNLNYWRFGDYLGIGAGAHGKLTAPASGHIERNAKLKHPRDYQLHAGTAAAEAERRIVSADELPLEFMLNALRLNEGFQRALWTARTGLDWQRLQPQLATALEQGWLEIDDEWVRPSASGRLYLNSLLELFLAD